MEQLDVNRNRRFPQLSPDAPLVPVGLRPREGVDYGCGKSICTACYERDAHPEQKTYAVLVSVQVLASSVEEAEAYVDSVLSPMEGLAIEWAVIQQGQTDLLDEEDDNEG